MTGTPVPLATLFPGSSSGGGSKAVTVPSTHVRDVTAASLTMGGSSKGSDATSGVKLGAASITGDADFQLTNDQCQGRTLGPADTCTLSIAFAPVVVGMRRAEVAVPFSQVGGASGQTYLVHLSGEGTSPSSTSTGPTGVPTKSPTGIPTERPTGTGAATTSTS
ncbi:hypothetical protein E6W39_35095 [Kitasatospora acidiphila]|uniref:Uncharacterized protein n=1 Tax=Kitasatospora acidiphila TaxID=2567942 RepID=A0A540WBP4_9ACTN|nr:hypothetical protein [Kitasatospora acidiphila]TQF06469.1 hypothetical protein E6W39_35095 [Kitasatospora acidiphila]